MNKIIRRYLPKFIYKGNGIWCIRQKSWNGNLYGSHHITNYYFHYLKRIDAAEVSFIKRYKKTNYLFSRKHDDRSVGMRMAWERDYPSMTKWEVFICYVYKIRNTMIYGEKWW